MAVRVAQATKETMKPMSNWLLAKRSLSYKEQLSQPPSKDSSQRTVSTNRHGSSTARLGACLRIIIGKPSNSAFNKAY